MREFWVLGFHELRARAKTRRRILKGSAGELLAMARA
jgi:hypothetical protein